VVQFSILRAAAGAVEGRLAGFTLHPV
jgi:hypothetical protein